MVEFTEQLGDATIVYVRLPWHPEMITVKLGQQQADYRMGDKLGLQVDPTQVLLFDSKGQRLLRA
jgi:ABC-type sugar transport system ATPase subunit